MSDAPPPRPRRAWVPIALAILAVLVFLALAAVGSTVWWVSRHIRSQEVSTAAAAEAFAEARARFAGAAPAITLEDGRPQLAEPAPGDAHPLAALHVLAYDRDNQRIVRIEIPGWMLRLMARGDVRVNDVSGLELRGRIRLQDIERRGPGLVLDTTTREGAQVLIWTD
jgi:hypothetical protein